MRTKFKHKYYVGGFISILLLYPLLTLYINNLKPINKYGIVLFLYQEPTDNTLSIIRRVPTYSLDLSTKKYSEKVLSELIELMNKINNGSINKELILIRLPEFQIYNDFIKVLDVFMSRRPYLIYVNEKNLLAIVLRTKINSYKDLDDGIYFKLKPWYPPKVTIWKALSMKIKDFYSTITKNNASIILFLAWIILSVISLKRLKFYRKS